MTSPEALAVRVPVSILKALSGQAAVAVGFSAEDAEVFAAALLGGSLRSDPGQGQGVQSLAKYIERAQRGVIDPRAEFEEISRAGATTLLDAHRMHGGIAATRAMSMAIDSARAHGIGAIGVRDSTHLGAAGHYAELAAAAGCIGLVFTNAGPEIAPWGATKPVVGTNPWAIAAPTHEGWPLVLDMANSTSGMGMVRWLQASGKTIPDDWALTADGQRTTDPAQALAGTLFPLGGAKGYAMATMVDVLTGALTDSAVGVDCFGIDHQNVGHLLVAIRISAFVSEETFLAGVERLISQIRESPLAKGSERVLLPGELEAERRRDRLLGGIPIPRERFGSLIDLARELCLGDDLVATLEALETHE